MRFKGKGSLQPACCMVCERDRRLIFHQPNSTRSACRKLLNALSQAVCGSTSENWSRRAQIVGPALTAKLRQVWKGASHVCNGAPRLLNRTCLCCGISSRQCRQHSKKEPCMIWRLMRAMPFGARIEDGQRWLRPSAPWSSCERCPVSLGFLCRFATNFIQVISLIVLPRMGESLLFLARLVGTTLWFFEPGGRMIRWSGGA